MPRKTSETPELLVGRRIRELRGARTLDDVDTKAGIGTSKLSKLERGKAPNPRLHTYAVPGDVNLEARVWVPRDAKGGFCPGVYLNNDQLAAWQLFLEADAWGPYNLGAFARTIRRAGWPADVRPYQARHSTWITASERGIDLEDIAAGAGHTDPRMTRRMYVPVLNSRLQRLGEALEGRFQGWPVVKK